MGRTFYPRESRYVDASAPHPEGIQYKVSIGDEDWEGRFQTVVKIQMAYNGKVAGRKSPSYPIESDDYMRVASVISSLLDENNRGVNNIIKIPADSSLKIGAAEYIAIVRGIPAGKISRTEDIEAYLCRKHQVKKVTIEYFPCPPFDIEGNDIPYWRVVGTHGYLSDERVCSRERKTEMLKREGIPIEPCGVDGRSLRVVDYKKHLVDFKRICP